MDPQASLTRAFGMADETDGLYHTLTDRAGLSVRTVSRNLTLTPSTIELGRAETELLNETGREFFLRTSLEKTALADGVVVLLDCPPSLGVLAVNCLTTAGGMIAVIQPGGLSCTPWPICMSPPRQSGSGSIPTSTSWGRSSPMPTVGGRLRGSLPRSRPPLSAVGDRRADARLLYATTAGTIHRLTTSKALDDYAEVVEQLGPVLP